MDWRYHLFKKTGYSSYTEETSGKTLEFIGTSGVGKTTLFRESVGKLKNRWFFTYHLDFIKRQTPPGEIDDALMQILKSRVENIYKSDSFCPWHSLLDLKLSVRVMHETMLVIQNAHPKGFAFDEGLFRHFPAEIIQRGDEFPIKLWNNRAFVYLRAHSPETALTRVRSRQMKAIHKQRQSGRTDDQLLARIVQDQEMFQTMVDRAISFGCPVLVIDTGNPFRDSIKKVLDFESSLGQKFGMQAKVNTNTQLHTN